MTKIEKAVDKIKKLLRLAESDNPHEAALAMANATKLMTKHDIEMSTINMDDDDAPANNVDGEQIDYRMEHDPWLASLALSVARLCNCKMYQVKFYRKRNSVYVWVGDPEHREMAKTMFSYLLHAWKRQMQRDLNHEKFGVYGWGQKDTIRYKKSHLHGYCQVLCSRVTEMRQEREEELKEAGTSLVPVDNAIKTYMDSKNLRTGHERVASRSSAGTAMGRARGNQQDINGRHVT